MTYPLGSFPRFGHQARWASERRNRAIMNSIFTRQMMAEEHLQKEIALHEVFCLKLQSANFLDEESQRELDEIDQRLKSIHRRHEAGKRVYYRLLTEIMVYFCEDNYPELKDMSQERLKLIAEDLAERHLRGETVIHCNTTDAKQKP